MSGTLIFGGNGQVARALKKRLPDTVCVGSAEANFLKPEMVLATLEKYAPEVILNAAAYTAVDKAESEELQAMQVNALTPGLIAEWAKKRGALLVHYSTDYVFDGSGTVAWKETDKTAPLSAYGRSKWLGEQEITRSGCRHFILRLCWVYDEEGKNFMNTMLRIGREKLCSPLEGERERVSNGEARSVGGLLPQSTLSPPPKRQGVLTPPQGGSGSIKIVADQIGAPTYAGDIAEATLRVLSSCGLQSSSAGSRSRAAFGSRDDDVYGIYHFANSGETSWAGFAEAIFAQAKLPVNVVPITTAEYPTPAKRPANSRLNTAKFRSAFGWAEIPDWQDALSRCMRAKSC